MPTPLGYLLVNDALPEEHRVTGALNKKALLEKMLAVAKDNPHKYSEVVSALKKVGDEVATLEGVSVGLDDIAPAYSARDAILKPALASMKKANTAAEKEKIVLDVQQKMLEHTKAHPGSMAKMALSGSRGNIPQLMKTVASPVAAQDHKGRIVPWLVGRSYSEGLSPGDAWVAAGESRINTVSSSTNVAEPGDLSKILINNTYTLVITSPDCNTTNGVPMSLADGHIIGRHLAHDVDAHKRNELITSKVAADLAKKHSTVVVRSPMTCDLDEGVCQKCQGLDEKGKLHEVGFNVGVRAAQAMSEPLTQFSLNAKHGGRVLKGATKKLEGLSGVRQLLEIPHSFFNKATLSEKPGRITDIKDAAHGGTFVYVDGDEHYVAPNLKTLVQVGQAVEAGDALSDGIPKPDELVRHKGLGAGRAYLVESLHDIYKNQGVDLDKRHLELLARADLNYVRVLSSDHGFIKGDVISYNQFKTAAQKQLKTVDLKQAVGHVLGKEVFHFTVGTPITKSIVDTLSGRGVKSVEVSMSAPQVEFLMKTASRNPLLNPDWMARLAHRFLKEGLVRGAHVGDSSNLHGVHPVPAYAYGNEFGQGPDGRY